MNNKEISARFRGYLPVVVDCETGGLNPTTDALLEIAVQVIAMDQDGKLHPGQMIHHHVEPYPGTIIKPESLEINKIDPNQPLRFAVTESHTLNDIFKFLQHEKQAAKCQKCILVGHNAWFDLAFLNAAIARNNIQNNPFHSFSSLDTATLGAIFYGHTVLAEILKRAKIEFDTNLHHSALYDTQKTAELFCKMVNNHQYF